MNENHENAHHGLMDVGEWDRLHYCYSIHSTEPGRESDYKRRDCAIWRQKRETFFSDPEPGLTKLPEQMQLNA